ncbi:hypothetical protein FXW78_51365 [Rhodococcus opacus]|nr:hypothetical protein [Rhodococcus opacus]
MTAAADLDEQLGTARDTLHALRRIVLDLAREYQALTALDLDTDKLGHPITAAEALNAARDALADVERALVMADDAADIAQRYTSRLKER